MGKNHSVSRCAAVSVLLMATLFLTPSLVVQPFSPCLYAAEKSPLSQSAAPSPAVPVQRITLTVLDGDTAHDMELETYLAGVLRAEMPATFEPEALKAQAVAARTYTLYKINTGGNHGQIADLCTNPACCQAWLAEESARENWGGQANAYEAKIQKAVTSTEGQVLLYDGAPILAVFHAASPGLTRTSSSVWQASLPYLQPVTSPEAGDTIPNYYSRAEFSPEELRQRILQTYPEANLSGSCETWLSRAIRDEAGSVETLEVGGISMKGSTLRSLLGLRSACFEWELQNGQFLFYVTGYGHGVGLSQYGANRMAQEGAEYREILTHYYTGVTVGLWSAPERFTIPS